MATNYNDWDVTVPPDDLLISNVPSAIRDVTSSAKIIISKEHVAPSTDQSGGQHLKGSARVYLQSSLPSTDPEGNTLDTSGTTDDGRIAVVTASSNALRVYIGTSNGVSTGWQYIQARRVHLVETMNADGHAIVALPNGTQSGQPIHVGQLDTSHFTGIAAGLLVLNVNTSYLETAHATGLTVKSASLVDELVSSSASLSIAKLAKFIKIGSYTGNGGSTQAISGVGFQPDAVLVLPHAGQAPYTENWVKTSTMGGYAKELKEKPYWSTDVIISLDADGFTVGTGMSNVLNTDGRTYSYVAIKGNA